MKQENILNNLESVKNDLDNYVIALYKQSRMIEMLEHEELNSGLCSEATAIIMYAHTADEISDKLQNAIYEIEDILGSKKYKKSILKELEIIK